MISIKTRSPPASLSCKGQATLHPRFSTLDSRVLKLERLDLRDARIEFRESSRDCQLTFERYCNQATVKWSVALVHLVTCSKDIPKLFPDWKSWQNCIVIMTVTYLTVCVTAGCFVLKKTVNKYFFVSLMSPFASSIVHLSVFCRKLWLDKNLTARMKPRLTATHQDKKKLTWIEAQHNNNYL